MSALVFEFIAAFGGGVFGAAIGALPAFIMTGVVAAISSVLVMAGVADVAMGVVAFGSFIGPHVAFAGGVAAAAYARKKGLLENGADIATALAGLNNAGVLLVGGIFGILGCGIKTLFGLFMAGNVSTKLVTDLPGITVFISGIIARLAFGERGLGSAIEDKTAGLKNPMNWLWWVGYSVMVSFTFVVLVLSNPTAAEAISGGYHTFVFGFAAIGLIFAEVGQGFLGWHHVGIISAEAVIAGFAAFGAVGGVVTGIVAGVVAGILCELETGLINSDVDSHIDGPAFAIFIMTIVLNLIFG